MRIGCVVRSPFIISRGKKDMQNMKMIQANYEEKS